jgi:BMFP domain-containing protein YqiC
MELEDLEARLAKLEERSNANDTPGRSRWTSSSAEDWSA